MDDKKTAPSTEENEGEGSKSADRDYRKHLREFEDENDVESLARAAEKDIERDPDGYKAAEKEGKRRMAEEDRELYKKE